MAEPIEALIRDLRDRIGHAEAWARANMSDIQERAEADKAKAWNGMLEATSVLRAQLRQIEQVQVNQIAFSPISMVTK